MFNGISTAGAPPDRQASLPNIADSEVLHEVAGAPPDRVKGALRDLVGTA
jgi:hypothetical protein